MSLLQRFSLGNGLKTLVRAASSFSKTAGKRHFVKFLVFYCFILESVYKYTEDAEQFPKATQEMREDFVTNGFVLVK